MNEPLTFNLDYAPSLESTHSVTLKKNYGLWINGQSVSAKSGKMRATINPANEELLAQISEASNLDVEDAVTAAQKAYEQVWSKTPGKERARLLFKVARIISERAKEFAVLECLDAGKTIKEARDIDIPLAAAHFFYYAGFSDKLNYLPFARDAKSLGVCGQIIPWNFPLLMAAWKLAPALACGNVCVLKPAETTPLTALLLAEVFADAGFPPGVVNVVTGGAQVGKAIVSHPKIAKIAFTGSTEVGKWIAGELADTNKKLTLELGGKSSNIVFADAAIDQAIEGVIAGIFFNQGQVCCAGSRLLLEESIYDEFLEKLKIRMQCLRLGNPLDKNTDIGAINSKEHLQKIKELVALGRRENPLYYEQEAKIPEKGFYHPACFFYGQSPSLTISRTEVFGPVLAIESFRSEEEAIRKANDTPYGLACGVWTNKQAKGQEMAKKVKAGVVWLNCYNRFDPCAAFGGYKESGFGREGGVYGLLPYLSSNMLH